MDTGGRPARAGAKNISLVLSLIIFITTTTTRRTTILRVSTSISMSIFVRNPPHIYFRSASKISCQCATARNSVLLLYTCYTRSEKKYFMRGLHEGSRVVVMHQGRHHKTVRKAFRNIPNLLYTLSGATVESFLTRLSATAITQTAGSSNVDPPLHRGHPGKPNRKRNGQRARIPPPRSALSKAFARSSEPSTMSARKS